MAASRFVLPFCTRKAMAGQAKAGA